MRIDVGLVTGNYFSVMGLSPVLGRSFNEGDDGTGAAPVMMLTHEYWTKRFGETAGSSGNPFASTARPSPWWASCSPRRASRSAWTPS